MDLEKRARRQSIKVIISEIFMVLVVIITVAVLAFVVSGYWVGSDFKVERQGMLQIYSTPTGASVAVDGDAPWYQRTNTSKVVASGEHTIKLAKDGYDSWSKTVNVGEGLLYRLHYPRLFPLKKSQEVAYKLPDNITMSTISPNRNYLLLASDTPVWTLLPLDADTIEPQEVDFSTVFSAPIGEIISAEWDRNNEHLLIKIKSGDTIEWVLLNARSPKNSINLTREFAANFTEIKILDNSASNLLAVRSGNLHKIDVSGRQISAILVSEVYSYDYFGNDIVYSRFVTPTTVVTDNTTENNTTENTTADSLPLSTPSYEIGTFHLGDSAPKVLATFPLPTRVLISQFYDDKYITTVSENSVKVYRKDSFEEVTEKTTSFIPSVIKVGHNGEFVSLISGEKFATLDMESASLREWQIDSSDYGWLDSDMLYSIKDGSLIVYDYDGLNRREIISGVTANFPVTITANKWLYFRFGSSLARLNLE